MTEVAAMLLSDDELQQKRGFWINGVRSLKEMGEDTRSRRFVDAQNQLRWVTANIVNKEAYASAEYQFKEEASHDTMDGRAAEVSGKVCFCLYIVVYGALAIAEVRYPANAYFWSIFVVLFGWFVVWQFLSKYVYMYDAYEYIKRSVNYTIKYDFIRMKYDQDNERLTTVVSV